MDIIYRDLKVRLQAASIHGCIFHVVCICMFRRLYMPLHVGSNSTIHMFINTKERFWSCPGAQLVEFTGPCKNRYFPSLSVCCIGRMVVRIILSLSLTLSSHSLSHTYSLTLTLTLTLSHSLSLSLSLSLGVCMCVCVHTVTPYAYTSCMFLPVNVSFLA
jgi:hypothetical protein